MTERRDPRLTPARPDLAAASLRGQVEAERFVEGVPRTVLAPVADLRRHPRADASLDTQALCGAALTLFDEREGWSWVQLAADGYVGYVPSDAIGAAGPAPTHRVTANRTFVYPAADMKTAVLAALPLGGAVAVAGSEGAYARLADGGFVTAAHLAPLSSVAEDFVAVAERLLHVPYLWGGRSPLGIDCSGLVQLSLACSGQAVPRDTPRQEEAIGRPIAMAEDLAGLRRGDLVFWSGHVGIMWDATTLLHANAHHMAVASEPLRQAVERILSGSRSPITSLRRISARR